MPQPLLAVRAGVVDALKRLEHDHGADRHPDVVQVEHP
jgi:hypothetical protein